MGTGVGDVAGSGVGDAEGSGSGVGPPCGPPPPPPPLSPPPPPPLSPPPPLVGVEGAPHVMPRKRKHTVFVASKTPTTMSATKIVAKTIRQKRDLSDEGNVCCRPWATRAGAGPSAA